MASQRHEEELRMKREQKRLEKLRSVKSTVDMGSKARPNKNPNRREPKVQLPDMNLFNVDYGNDRIDGLQRRPRISPAKATSDASQDAPLGPTLRARHDVKPASRGANGYGHEGDENDDNFNAYQGPINKPGISALDIFEEMTPGVGMVPSVMASRSPKPRDSNFTNMVGGSGANGGGNERTDGRQNQRHQRHQSRQQEQPLQSHSRKKDQARLQQQQQHQYSEAGGDEDDDDDDDESEVAALAEAMELNRRLRAAMQGNAAGHSDASAAAAVASMEFPSNKHSSNKGRTREDKVPRAGYRGMRQLQEEKQQLATMSQRSESAPALGASQAAALAAPLPLQQQRSSAYGAPADPRQAARAEKKRRHPTKPPSDAWQDGPDRSPVRRSGSVDYGSGGCEDRGAMVEYGPPVRPSGRDRKDSRAAASGAAAAEPLQPEAVAAAQAAARRAGEYRERQRAKQLPSSPRGKDRAKLMGAKVSPINPDPRSGVGGPRRNGADARGEIGERGEDEVSEATTTAAAASGQGASSVGNGTKARAAAVAAAETKAGGATVLKDGKGVGALREELDEAVKLLADIEANPLGTSSYTPRESTSRGHSGHGNRRRPRQGPTAAAATTKTGAPSGAAALSGGGGAAAAPSEISGALDESALAAAAENLRLRASLAKVATVKKLSPAKAVSLSAGKNRPSSRTLGEVGASREAGKGAEEGHNDDDDDDDGTAGSSRTGSPARSDPQQPSRREAFNAWCRQNAAGALKVASPAATAAAATATAPAYKETLPVASSPILLPAEAATHPVSSKAILLQQGSPVLSSEAPAALALSAGSPVVIKSPKASEPSAVPKSPHAVSISPVVVSEPPALPKSPALSHRSPKAATEASAAAASVSPAAVLNLAVASESAMPSHEPCAPPSTQKSAAGLFSDSQLSDLLQYQSEVPNASSHKRNLPAKESSTFPDGSPWRSNSPSKKKNSASVRCSPNGSHHHHVPSSDEAIAVKPEAAAVVPAPSSLHSLGESSWSKSETLYAAMHARVKASGNGEEEEEEREEEEEAEGATGTFGPADTEVKEVNDRHREGSGYKKGNARDDDSDEDAEGIEPTAGWTKESDHAVMHDISPAGWGWCQEPESPRHVEESDNDEEDVDSNAAAVAVPVTGASESERGTGELESDEEEEYAGDFEGDGGSIVLHDEVYHGSNDTVPASVQNNVQPLRAPAQQQQLHHASRHVPPPADTRVRVEKGELRLKRLEFREVD